MAYLPGYNLGCPDKRAELIIEKNGKKVECNFNISDQLVISIIVTKKAACKESSVRQPGRAENNGQSTENVRPDRGLDQSNSGLAGHFWIQTFYFQQSCRLMLYNGAMISFFFGVFCCFALNPSKKKNTAIN